MEGFVYIWLIIPFNSILWNMFIMLLSLFFLIIALTLQRLSGKPVEWRHKPVSLDKTMADRFILISDNLRYSTGEGIRYILRSTFLEKIGIMKGLSDSDIYELDILIGEKDKEKLLEIIKDEKIVDWLLAKWKPLVREEDYHMLYSIIDRMEKWSR